MNLHYLLFFNIIYTTFSLSSNIKNIEKPACVNCKFYKPENYNTFDSTLNKCLKYGEKNIHDGKIYYEFVSMCRRNEEKCGENGLNYEEEPNLATKKLIHNLNNYSYAYTSSIILITSWSIILSLINK